MYKKRCGWCESSQLYRDYHDQEWGMPVYDDQTLFEFLVLETQQAGLSWITVLKKREAYRVALDDFSARKISDYDYAKIEELLNNPGVIRHRKKIEAIVHNARCFLAVQRQHGSFSNFLWGYVDHKPIQNKVTDYRTAPTSAPLSDKLSKDMKKLGFKFIGTTTIYAFMQAVGMVNDHEVSCHRYSLNHKS